MGKQKRIWREHQHPRDAKGRFSQRGGTAWIQRAAAELTSAPGAGDTRSASGRPQIARSAKAGVVLQAHADGGRPSAVRAPKATVTPVPSPKSLAMFNAKGLPTPVKRAAPPVKNLDAFNAPDPKPPVKRTPRPSPGAAALIAARQAEQAPQVPAMVAARTESAKAPSAGAAGYAAMKRHTLVSLARAAGVQHRGKSNTEVGEALAAKDAEVKASRAAKLNPGGVGQVDTPRVNPQDGGMTPKPTKRQAAKLQAEQDAAEREAQYQVQKAERDAQEATRRAEHEAAMETKRAVLRAKNPAGVRPADGRPSIGTVTSRTTNPREKWDLGNTPGSTRGAAPNMVISPVGHIDNREANARIMNPLAPGGPYRYEIRDENTGEIIESGEDRDLDKVYAKANRIMSRTQGGGMARTVGKSTRFEARTTERPKDSSRGDFGKGPFYEHTVVEIDQDGNETVRVQTSSAVKAEAHAVEMNAKEQAANPKAAPEPGSDEAKLAAKRAELEAAQARFQREADWRPSGGMRTKSFGVRVDANLRRAGEAGRDIERLEHEIKVLELRTRPKKPVTNDVEGLEPGDLVKMKNGLTYKVAKVNGKSVKVVVPPGMDDLMPKSKIVQTQKASVTPPKVEAPAAPAPAKKVAPAAPQPTFKVRRDPVGFGGLIRHELVQQNPDGTEVRVNGGTDEGALIKQMRRLKAEQGPVISSAKLETEEAKLRARLDAMRAKRAGNTRKKATQAELDVIERLQNLAPQLARSRREEKAASERANPRGLGGMTGVDPKVLDRLIRDNLANGGPDDRSEARAVEAVANGTVPIRVAAAALHATDTPAEFRRALGIPEPTNRDKVMEVDASEVHLGDIVNVGGLPFQVTTITGSGSTRQVSGRNLDTSSLTNPRDITGRVKLRRPAGGAAPKADAAPVAAPRAADLEVRDAYADAARMPGDWVPLAEIRDRLAKTGLSRAEVDAALEKLAMTPGVQIIPWDNRKALTQRDRDAALDFGGEMNHNIRIEGVTPKAAPARSRITPDAKRGAIENDRQAGVAEKRAANLKKARTAATAAKVADLRRSDDPKDNSAKINAIRDGRMGAVDLYRQAHAGPSGQRKNIRVGTVRHTPDNQTGEYTVTGTDGETSGYVTATVRDSESRYAVYRSDGNGGTELLGWADTLAHAADVLNNGEAAASSGGTLDARRISGRLFERNPNRNKSLAELEREALNREIGQARESLANPRIGPQQRASAEKRLARLEAERQGEPETPIDGGQTGPGTVPVGGTDADRAAARPRMENETDRAYAVRTAPTRDAALSLLNGHQAAGLRAIAREEGVVTSGTKADLVARLIRVMRDRHADSVAITNMVNRDRTPAPATVTPAAPRTNAPATSGSITPTMTGAQLIAARRKVQADQQGAERRAAVIEHGTRFTGNPYSYLKKFEALTDEDFAALTPDQQDNVRFVVSKLAKRAEGEVSRSAQVMEKRFGKWNT